MKNALWYESAGKDSSVRCLLCPHGCVIKDGESGFCRVRINDSGKLVAAGYGRIVSANLDPIEKKPLYHFFPGQRIMSFGSAGCNLRCSFCQNWEISQCGPEEIKSSCLSPREAVSAALNSGSFAIAYTYNEPLINFEWLMDTARLAKDKGLKNVVVTNGFISEGPLKDLIKTIDAANIDVKFMNEEKYKKLCSGSLAPVLGAVKEMFKSGIHVEITNLIIPGENDSEEDIEKLAAWAASIDKRIPLHLSGYFPCYKMDRPAADAGIMKNAYKMAKKYMHNVYTGNIDIGENDTFCRNCGNLLVKREGYAVQKPGLSPDGSCGECKGSSGIVLQEGK